MFAIAGQIAGPNWLNLFFQNSKILRATPGTSASFTSERICI